MDCISLLYGLALTIRGPTAAVLHSKRNSDFLETALCL